MVDENDVVLDTTNVTATLSLGSVREVGVSEGFDECRDLRARTMLGCKCFMRKAFENQALEKGSVEFKTITLFNSQLVVVDFRTQLPVDCQSRRGVLTVAP